MQWTVVLPRVPLARVPRLSVEQVPSPVTTTTATGPLASGEGETSASWVVPDKPGGERPTHPPTSFYPVRHETARGPVCEPPDRLVGGKALNCWRAGDRPLPARHPVCELVSSAFPELVPRPPAARRSDRASCRARPVLPRWRRHFPVLAPWERLRIRRCRGSSRGLCAR